MSYVQGFVTGASVVVAAVCLVAAAKPQKLGTIDVERINVREPDGTLRMVISSKDRFPGSFHKGEEIARPNRSHAAGMLFLNDEGTENGGLIWAGKKDSKGVNAGASLTFDRYENDQTLQILQTDSSAGDRAGIVISDRPSESMFTKVNGKAALRANGSQGPSRLFIGKSRDRASVMMLQDGSGKPRLMLKVATDGSSSIDFLDDQGEVVRSIGPKG